MLHRIHLEACFCQFCRVVLTKLLQHLQHEMHYLDAGFFREVTPSVVYKLKVKRNSIHGHIYGTLFLLRSVREVLWFCRYLEIPSNLLHHPMS